MTGQGGTTAAIGSWVLVAALTATACAHPSSAAQEAKQSCRDAYTFVNDIQKLPSMPGSPTSYIVNNPGGTIPNYPTTTVTPTIRAVGVEAMSLATSAAKRDRRLVPLAATISNFVRTPDPLGPNADQKDLQTLLEQCVIAGVN